MSREGLVRSEFGLDLNNSIVNPHEAIDQSQVTPSSLAALESQQLGEPYLINYLTNIISSRF